MYPNQFVHKLVKYRALRGKPEWDICKYAVLHTMSYVGISDYSCNREISWVSWQAEADMRIICVT